MTTPDPITPERPQVTTEVLAWIDDVEAPITPQRVTLTEAEWAHIHNAITTDGDVYGTFASILSDRLRAAQADALREAAEALVADNPNAAEWAIWLRQRANHYRETP